jgi:hypothetical protein
VRVGDAQGDPADAARKTLLASKARWNPEVRASAGEAWLASRWPVREVAIAEKIASPCLRRRHRHAAGAAPRRAAVNRTSAAGAAVTV